MMTAIYICLAVLLAYLIGSIPSAIWIGKIFHGIDIREHGSGNAGATNVIRVLGYKAGIPVLLFDVFKGWAAVQLSFLFPSGLVNPETLVYIRISLSLAAVLGHIFPVYAGFRGGKGVGTIAGAAIALYPLALLVVLGVFILVLAISRYVSLSSILAGLSFPLAVIFLTSQRNPGMIGLSLVVAIFIPLTHRKNIKRLIQGKENKFDFRKKKKDNA
jgi:acyl phosphate:glycerol-3-phosphate acyltransferase